MLLLLNAHNIRHQGELGKASKEIIEVLSFKSDATHSTIKNYYQRNLSWQRRERANAEERHVQTIAAILTTQDGQSRTISGIPSKSIHGGDSRHVSDLQATIFRQASEKNPVANFTINDCSDLTKRVLDALHFRSIDERRTTILNAHKNTFEWVFSKSEDKVVKWDNLPEWLRHGAGCYWINGKAGSGKSTLMKFIWHDGRTTQALKAWSASSDLVIASFYFWSAGTPLQKSQEGLLRALLLAILERRPELVAAPFPNLCRAIISYQIANVINFTFAELKIAFMALVCSISDDLKVCFLIDGIDEY